MCVRRERRDRDAGLCHARELGSSYVTVGVLAEVSTGAVAGWVAIAVAVAAWEAAAHAIIAILLSSRAW